MEWNEWKQTAAAGDIREGVPVVVKVDGEDVLLVRRNGRVCACGNTCTHYGGPLNEGVLADNVAVCPWHNSRFDVETGKLLSGPALDSLPTWEVDEENGRVLLGAKEENTLPVQTLGDVRTFVLLGAGASSTAAALTLRREGFAGSIIMVTAEDDGPYDRPTLSKGYAEGKAGDDELPLRPDGFFETHHIRIMNGKKVVRVEPEEHRIVFDTGDALGYDKLLLATGGTPKTLDVPGGTLPGVFTYRTWSDAKAVAAAVERVERVVLAGAGFISMELASGFRVRGKEVTVVAPGRVPFASALGEKVGERLMRVHEAKGVRFRMGRNVKEIRGGAAVETVVLDTGEELGADMVIIGIGVRPAVGCLEGTGIVEDGAVPVDGFFRTKEKDIYAAGDIASLPGDGARVRVEHWAVAEREGMYAARSMLGLEREYGEPPFFWTSQQGVSLKYIGYAAKFDSVLFRGDVENGNFLAGYYEGGQLRAAATVGMTRALMAIGELMRRRTPIPVSTFVDERFNPQSMLREGAD